MPCYVFVCRACKAELALALHIAELEKGDGKIHSLTGTRLPRRVILSIGIVQRIGLVGS